ncbi:MAG TPA: SRPBCC domain-containing protein [Gammaproteobacteria bacterium]
MNTPFFSGWLQAYLHFWSESLARLDVYLCRLQENRTRRTPMTETMGMQQVEHAGGVLVMRRVFDAPPGRLFDAWTRPEQFAQWFGPKGASVPRCVIDPEAGGVLHFFMHVPGDIDVWCKGIFSEVTRPSRLAFRWHFSNEAGDRVERKGFPLETAVTVTFSEHAGGTELVMRQEGLLVDQGEIQGWTEGFDRLDALLERIQD